MRSFTLVVITMLFVATPCLAANELLNMATSQVAAPFGIAVSTDPALKQAVDFLLESQKAAQAKKRRSNVHPGIQDKVVDRKDATEKKRVLILGGPEAFPM